MSEKWSHNYMIFFKMFQIQILPSWLGATGCKLICNFKFHLNWTKYQEAMNLIQKVLSGEQKCQKNQFFWNISSESATWASEKLAQLFKLYNFLIEYSSQNPSFIGDPAASSKCEFVRAPPLPLPIPLQ